MTKMRGWNCRKVSEGLTLWLDGLMDSGASKALEVHLDSCAACREHAQELRQVKAQLAKLPGVSCRPGFWPAVGYRLQTEGRTAPAPRLGARRRLWAALPVGLGLAFWLLIGRPSAPVAMLGVRDLVGAHAVAEVAGPAKDFSGLALVSWPGPVEVSPEHHAPLPAPPIADRTVTDGGSQEKSQRAEALLANALGMRVSIPPHQGTRMMAVRDGDGWRVGRTAVLAYGDGSEELLPPGVRIGLAVSRGTPALQVPAPPICCGGTHLTDGELRNLAVQNYRLAWHGESKLAERTVDCLAASPAAKDRPAHLLWVDKQTGLWVRHCRYGPDGTLLTCTGFEDLAFAPTLAKPGPPRLLINWMCNEGRAHSCKCCSAAQGISMPLGLPSELPGGYRLLSAAPGERGKLRWTHLAYTDGIDCLSVFYIPGASEPLARPESATVISLGGLRLHHWRVGPLTGVDWQGKAASWAVVGYAASDLLLKVSQALESS